MIIVVDVGGTHVRVGHLANGRPAGGGTRHSTDGLRAGDAVTALSALIRDYAGHVKPTGTVPARVIVGIPTSLGHDRDLALSSPNIPSLENRRVATELRAALGCPVTLERDIVLLTRGEWAAGAAAGAGSVLGVFIGTGVGACLLQGGRAYAGASGVAVELGHIPIRAEGRVCVCGNVDCLEAYASGRQLRVIAERHGVPIERVFTAEIKALQTETQALVRDLAYACATATNLMDPELLLVGGGLPAMAGFPHAAFEAIWRAHLRRPLPADNARLAWAALGHRASLHGAVAMLTEPTLLQAG